MIVRVYPLFRARFTVKCQVCNLLIVVSPHDTILWPSQVALYIHLFYVDVLSNYCIGERLLIQGVSPPNPSLAVSANFFLAYKVSNIVVNCIRHYHYNVI